SFPLTVKVPAFASTDVISPVRRLVFAFSDFSIAGAAGVGGGAGFAFAETAMLKNKIFKTKNKKLIMFFMVSPPSCVLDVVFQKCFNLLRSRLTIGRNYSECPANVCPKSDKGSVLVLDKRGGGLPTFSHQTN